MIRKVSNILPHQTNHDILNFLIHQGKWKLADDAGRFGETERTNATAEKMIEENVSNSGFSFVTYDRRYNLHVDTPLNLYADIIFYTLKNKLKDMETLQRVYWNYYDSSAEANFHKDEFEKGFVSVVYNLHTNDGGTEIEEEFYPSVGGQAIIFPSNVDHRGRPSKSTKHRFNLNMIVKLK